MRRPDKEKKPIHKYTINLPYSMYLELRLHSVNQGLYLSELVNQILQDYLNEQK